MNDYGLVFVTLFSTLLGYWFCGHCVAVSRIGGPKGRGCELYQRAVHPIRFWIYVTVAGIIGLLFLSFAIYEYAKLWHLIAPA